MATSTEMIPLDTLIEELQQIQHDNDGQGKLWSYIEDDSLKVCSDAGASIDEVSFDADEEEG